MKEHFKTHGAVHAFWTISVLLAVIAWLLLRSPRGDVIGNYIGFASSVASLLLALVAIGYAYASNQSFGQTVGLLQSSSNSLETAAQNIAITSSSLNERFEDMVGQVARVPVAVEELSAKLDARAAAEPDRSQPLLVDDGQENKTVRFMRGLRYGTQVGMYILAKSFVTRRAFSPSKIFGPGERQSWGSIITGFVISVFDLKPCGLEIEGFDNSGDRFYSVGKLGEIDPSQVILYLAPKVPEDDVLKEINAYFNGRSPSAPEISTSST